MGGTTMTQDCQMTDNEDSSPPNNVDEPIWELHCPGEREREMGNQ